ncbi:MAG: hypothetical protein NC391_04695 [Alistipes timonensis]|nr:hypothetical protein [Alistipes timonensis]
MKKKETAKEQPTMEKGNQAEMQPTTATTSQVVFHIEGTKSQWNQLVKGLILVGVCVAGYFLAQQVSRRISLPIHQ